ncbi:centromere protein U [Osmerus eperlanus]|uniref:centromere protein U n=1 Tax=Osmerus eperlanus TaxID=29151 RepID=UPI002E11E97D
MSSRKIRAKMPKVAPQKDKPESRPSYLNVSSIEKDSSLHEYHNYGNPMHSTALEEDLSHVVEQKEGAQAREGQRQPHQSSTVVAPKKAPRTGRGKAQTKDRSGQSSPAKASVPGRTERKSQGLKERPVKKRLKRAADPATVSQPQAVSTVSPSSPSPTKKRQRPSLSSEDLSDNEDPNWNNGQKRAKSRKSASEKVSNRKSPGNRRNNRKSSAERKSLQDKKRKSSSGTSDTTGAVRKVDLLQRVRNPGELDVVLDSFLEFTSLYSEAVGSKAVCQAIDALSHSVQEQLSEKIAAAKELDCLRRDTRKVTSAINKKRERLLEAKNEAIRKEKEVRGLQREKARLQQRLEDLRKGSGLLSGLANLHRNYRQHVHLDQPQQYGVSSLPALLLEAQQVLGAEEQLRTLNGRLEQALEKVV